jgi:transcriptional regulator with XRE-family HTH domain
MSSARRRTDVDLEFARIHHTEKVARALRKLRRERGMSVTDLAAKISMGASALSKIEGGTAALSFHMAERVAEVLDCTLDDLSPVETDAEREAAE